MTGALKTAEQELQAVKDVRDGAVQELAAAEREYQDLLTRARAGDRSVESLLAGIGGRLLFARTALEGAEAAVLTAEDRFVWRIDAERQAAVLAEYGSNADFQARMLALSVKARDALAALAMETWKRNTAVGELNTSMARHMETAGVSHHPTVPGNGWLRGHDLEQAAAAILGQASRPVRAATSSQWARGIDAFGRVAREVPEPNDGGPFKLYPKP